jgi:hypothetical protein
MFLTLVSVNNSYEYFQLWRWEILHKSIKYDTPDSGVSEYFRKKLIWRRNFLCQFFLFILYYYLPFLDGSKKKYCMTYLHLTVIVHTLSTSTKNTNTEKNKTKCEVPTNKSTKAPNIFGIFCYRKGVYLVKYQIWMGIKHYGQDIRVCFAKHTLSKHNLGRLGLKLRPDPFFFFFLGWI